MGDLVTSGTENGTGCVSLVDHEAMKARIEQLESVLAALQSHAKLDVAAAPSNKIKFDVGGQHFATTVETLTKLPNTYFAAMFSGNWALELDSEGFVFLDRDPILFGIILQYLRTYPHVAFDLNRFNTLEKHLLKLELQFYGIEPLLRLYPRVSSPPDAPDPVTY